MYLDNSGFIRIFAAELILNDKYMDKKIISILKTLYEVVRAEENGSAEHICEYFDSESLEEILKENGVQVGSNLTDDEIDEAIDDFLSETGMKFFERSKVVAWLEKTDLNSDAKNKFLRKIIRII
jgi:hypothetical protein